VARALIVGCGCGGRALGESLLSNDWRVRGTSRDEDGLAAIEGAGLEAAVADPDLPGTVLDVCADVSVVVWLLGSARGEPELISAIHGPRLERLLEKLVDSPVRGFAYEVSGSVQAPILEGGREIVERAAETWRIPVAQIEGERSSRGWADRAADAVLGLLT
jgi:nucleoside-diphosphate-sugar epimerase